MTTSATSLRDTELRRRAEELVRQEEESHQGGLDVGETQQILHELRVHQLELEMQNEELRRTQHELEVARARYFDLYDLAPVGYLTIDAREQIIEANLTAATLLGVVRGTLLNRPFTRYIFPADQDIYYLQRKQLVERGVVQSWEMRLQHADGANFWAHLQAMPSQNNEIRITFDDISEIRQSRLNQLKIEKMEALGILAGGIAHDFNNVLAVILGNISLAHTQLNEPEEVSKRLDVAEKAVDRAKSIARQLLTFARGGEHVRKSVDVRAILKEAAGFALHGSNVTCTLSLADDLGAVDADEGQIVQVIHNLVLNAVQAMPQGGTVTVSADDVVSRSTGKKFVRFSIADTGCGISEEHLAKIFDPYFTTKQHGSGLGLATCHSIITKHGGKIRATSVLGEGSTFTISLPAVVQAAVTDTRAPESDSRGCGHILLMDDEEAIRQVVQAFLERLGYTVVCTVNGAEAVACYRKSKEQGMPFDVVMLDLTIPGGVGGKEIISELLEIDPAVQAIACSGYTTIPIMANYQEYGFKRALCKPFHFEDLRSTLRELLTR